MTSNLPVVLCVQYPEGERFVVRSINRNVPDPSRLVSEAAARAQLRALGLSDADIDAEVERARKWVTTASRRRAPELHDLLIAKGSQPST